jgi:hypothetical protein
MTPVLPIKAGEVYHVVAMEWFSQWKKYTDFKSVETPTGDGTA